MKEKKFCHECAYRVYSEQEAIRFLDRDYHRSCLERVLAKVHIHVELHKMGLDTPPKAA